jgi:hypothetical protein
MQRFKKNGLWILSGMVLAGVGALLIGYREVRTQMVMDKAINIPKWESVSSKQWQILAGKKVFFAHMSVGRNILDGVNDVLQKQSVISQIVLETSNPDEMIQPGLYHTMLGYNAQPLEKISSFRSLLEQIRPARPDIVMMKFCYVDMMEDTDVNTLFDTYQKTIQQVQATMPGTVFMHCTVPLESTPLSLKEHGKEMVKAVLGRTTIVNNNEKRMQYNNLVRQTWPASQIFDIALIESVTPEGFLCCKARPEQNIPFLAANYTSDGGHLNQLGAHRAGQQFLISLVNAVASQHIIKE